MAPIFKHNVFDSAWEKMEKSQETFENSLCTCFKYGSNKIFSIAKRSGLLTREHLCSMSAVIVTINGGMDK